MLIYVNDVVLGAAKQLDMEWIKAALRTAFDMTDLRKLKTLLRLEITCDRSRLLLAIHQGRYFEWTLERH